jgi:hypothetical protein
MTPGVLAVAVTLPPVTVSTAQRGYATALVAGRYLAAARVYLNATATAVVTG